MPAASNNHGRWRYVFGLCLFWLCGTVSLIFVNVLSNFARTLHTSTHKNLAQNVQYELIRFSGQTLFLP